MTLRRTLATLALTGAIASVGVVAVATPASAAEVANGQYVNAASYACGAQEVATGATLGPEGVLRQRALVFRNCGSSTVERKADIIADFDGSCYSVAPGKARVLDALFVAAGRNTYRASKAC
ncbi:hypothetical protein [Rathayibacter sp. AY1B5]|uniref:hypothetical protein n=1 Tax=Rathayibacter sp. AY1B5 TaxID=2080530 RepID=UPI000CE846E6|nr:hypothetical protein [Rathayibacter sp. AY1B5]PPI28343.1 hypothetical protein C5D44_01065 [Rathayibacter sp. AY1B5]